MAMQSFSHHIFLLPLILATLALYVTPGDLKLVEPIYSTPEAVLKGKCTEKFYNESEQLMCKPSGPHVLALSYTMRQKYLYFSYGPICRPAKGRGPDGAEYSVQSCCVQACRIQTESDMHIVGYFLSGRKEARPGKFWWDEKFWWNENRYEEDDGTCGDCWGMAVAHKFEIESSKGAICSKGETVDVTFQSYGSKGAPLEDPNVALAVERIPHCRDVTFTSQNRSLQTAPSWLLKTESGSNLSNLSNPIANSDLSPSKSEAPKESPQLSEEIPNASEKEDGSDKWKWAGPLLALIGAIIAGICGIIGMRCSRGVTINTRNDGDAIAIDEVKVYER